MAFTNSQIIRKFKTSDDRDTWINLNAISHIWRAAAPDHQCLIRMTNGESHHIDMTVEEVLKVFGQGQ